MNAKKAKARRRRFRLGSARVLATFVLAVVTMFLGACSLVVESAKDQCTTNNDCNTFGNGSVCLSGVCVVPINSTSSSSSSSSGMGGGGGGPACFSGTPTTDPEFFNQCTNATCVEFDNCARLGLCDGAALPALIDPPIP